LLRVFYKLVIFFYLASAISKASLEVLPVSFRSFTSSASRILLVLSSW